MENKAYKNIIDEVHRQAKAAGTLGRQIKYVGLSHDVFFTFFHEASTNAFGYSGIYDQVNPNEFTINKWPIIKIDGIQTINVVSESHDLIYGCQMTIRARKSWWATQPMWIMARFVEASLAATLTMLKRVKTLSLEYQKKASKKYQIVHQQAAWWCADFWLQRGYHVKNLLRIVRENWKKKRRYVSKVKRLTKPKSIKASDVKMITIKPVADWDGFSSVEIWKEIFKPALSYRGNHRAFVREQQSYIGDARMAGAW